MQAPDIILPYFPVQLSPNTRVHWAVKSKAVKQARQDGYIATKAAKITPDMFHLDKKIHVYIYFYSRTKKWPDDDNCLAAFKPYRDGIADALGVDDKMFQSHPVVMQETGSKMIVSLRQ